jgi:ribosomal protein S27E
MNDQVVFGKVATTRVLCKCGAVAELDRSVLKTKRYLGKNVECRRCRNNRIAREKDELDKEYFDIHETLD